jgi:chemotaxis protein MotB
MSSGNDEHKTEILIIRRHGGDDHGGHHGGAWKIAYADFVTAMMAFFLVMWLINSSNEVTKSRVASYFNPIKMTDAAPASKGLQDIDPSKKSQAKAKSDNTEEKPGQSENSKGAANPDQGNTTIASTNDDALHDPYKTIEKISQEGLAHPSGRTVEVVSESAGDPFDPKAWEALREGKLNTDVSSADSAGRTPLTDKASANSSADQQASQAIAKATAKDAGKETAPAAEIASAQSAAKEVAPKDATAKDTTAKDIAAQNPLAKDTAGQSIAPSKTPDAANQEIVSKAEQEIRAAIAAAGAEGDLQATVKTTAEGLLIVLNDASSNPMFTIGSAKPTPALIEVIDTIGKILSTQDGKVIVRGHTDARQYKSLNFDNWQLSTARAHMASYILMHGGLDEKKILKIEGYGSSEPIDAADPLADANRRVEFLLRK